MPRGALLRACPEPFAASAAAEVLRVAGKPLIRPGHARFLGVTPRRPVEVPAQGGGGRGGATTRGPRSGEVDGPRKTQRAPGEAQPPPAFLALDRGGGGHPRVGFRAPASKLPGAEKVAPLALRMRSRHRPPGSWLAIWRHIGTLGSREASVPPCLAREASQKGPQAGPEWKAAYGSPDCKNRLSGSGWPRPRSHAQRERGPPDTALPARSRDPGTEAKREGVSGAGRSDPGRPICR